MIISYATQRLGEIVVVTVTSSLSGVVYYHWYLDGIYQGQSTLGQWTFRVAEDEQARVDAVDTNDGSFDADAGNPQPYPARRVLWWVRSLDEDVAYYRIEQRADAGDWASAATVARNRQEWSYQWTTGRLDDLTEYEWRVIPVDEAGNDGDPVATAGEVIVRTPDAPVFEVAFDSDTGRVTFTEDS